MELVTAAQMRAIEQVAIESGEVTGLELMERAGQAVVEAIYEEWPKLAALEGPKAVILCGPGNNSGDGFVVARLLNERDWDVEVFLYGDPEKLPSDAQANYLRWLKKGKVEQFNERSVLAAAKKTLQSGAASWIVLDALFGIGQRPPLDEVLAPVNALVSYTFENRTGSAPFFLSIDVPTGYDTDTGEELASKPFPCDLIVTFHAAKPVHQAPPLMDSKTIIKDIGL